MFFQEIPVVSDLSLFMRDRTIIPTNLMDWPRVAPLLPEVKFIYSSGFWGSRYTNMIGVAEIPLRPLAASLGLDPSALQSGIKVLCHEELIVGDWETYEFFIFDWFRFHKFKGAGIAMALQQFSKIRSSVVQKIIFNAAPWLADTPAIQSKQRGSAPTAEKKETSSSAGKIRDRRLSGIVTYWPTDSERAARIEKIYTGEQIALAVIAVEKDGKEPVPGLIEKAIESQIKAEARKAEAAKSSPPQCDQATVARRSDQEMATIWRAIGLEPPKCS